LSAAGYRASRDGHHYRIIQSLSETIGADSNMIARLDAFRKKRNISDYERSGAISIQEAKEMYILARNIRKSVADWLKKNHPRVLKE
jgi:hypothetical protein